MNLVTNEKKTKTIVAAALINPAGQLLFLQRGADNLLVLPGRVIRPDEQFEQDVLHESLRELGITFDQASRMGVFLGPGLPGWDEVIVRLFCLYKNRFTIHGSLLGNNLHWINPEQQESIKTTDVECLCLEYLKNAGIWPRADVRKTAEAAA